MKLMSLFKKVEKATITLPENQLFSVKGKNVEIHCLYGTLWVTWPNRNERILKGGQTFRVSSKGKVCIMALSNASFKINKRRWFANAQTHGESGAENTDTDIFPIPFETQGLLHPIEKVKLEYIRISSEFLQNPQLFLRGQSFLLLY